MCGSGPQFGLYMHQDTGFGYLPGVGGISRSGGVRGGLIIGRPGARFVSVIAAQQLSSLWRRTAWAGCMLFIHPIVVHP